MIEYAAGHCYLLENQIGIMYFCLNPAQKSRPTRYSYGHQGFNRMHYAAKAVDGVTYLVPTTPTEHFDRAADHFDEVITFEDNGFLITHVLVVMKKKRVNN